MTYTPQLYPRSFTQVPWSNGSYTIPYTGKWAMILSIVHDSSSYSDHPTETFTITKNGTPIKTFPTGTGNGADDGGFSMELTYVGDLTQGDVMSWSHSGWATSTGTVSLSSATATFIPTPENPQ